jgi:predicted nucleic acid-binding protein
VITHLADSDWVIDYLRRQDAAVRLLRPLMQDNSLAISVITYAEVFDGVIGGRNREQDLSQLRTLLTGTEVMGLDPETAELFAQLRVSLRSRGELLADHDIWIASTALRHDLVLLTRDQHFDRFDQLRRT